MGVQLGSNGQPDLGYYWNGNSGSGNWTSGFTSFYPLAGVNNNGIAAGQELTVGAYWSPSIGLNGTGKLLLSDPSSSIDGLNDNTYLVGDSGSQAILFDTSSQQMYNMNNYLTGSMPFSQLNNLTDINNSNQFTGVGQVNGVQHGCVGTLETPEPGTLTLLAAASLAVVGKCLFWAARRRREQGTW